MIGGPGGTCGRVRQHERANALRIGRGEERRHQRPFVRAHDGGAVAADRVQHGSHVVHPLLQRRQPVERYRVRQADPMLVERDQPAERGQPPQVVREARNLPTRLHMAEPGGDQQQVEISLADNLVGDVNAVLLRISGLSKHAVIRMRHASDEVNRGTEHSRRCRTSRGGSGAIAKRGGRSALATGI